MMATEWKLAGQLKKQCYSNGKERNLTESAETIHKLGLLYRNKKPEKISLIQSAVLLNAVIVRTPDNAKVVQQDLKLLISDVLLRANAEKKDADLLEFSVNIRNELHVFRKKVQSDLALLKPPDESLLAEGKEIERNNKISQVMSIQHFVTEKYFFLMRKINDYCVDIMGQPPCRYALIGMGSIAHKEITPYSDFESAIVLEEGVDDKVVEYFRWCSVLFQLVLACLQETIIRFIAIESLNDPTRPGGDWFHDAFTPCGVCSDGFAPQASKHPLGRQKPTEKKSWITELIKPVSEMIKYLESDEDLKNGYHLADVLSKTCFVAGDSDIYDKFCLQSQVQLDLNDIAHKNKLLKEIDANLDDFDALELLRKTFSHQLDVKRLLYRTSTIFVSGLGKYFDASCNSNFDVLDRLIAKGVITQGESNHLKYAVAISCEARLKTYMKTKGQNDIFNNRWIHNSEVAVLVQELGKTCILDYFLVVRCFIKSLRKLRDKKKQDFKTLTVDFWFTDPLLSAIVCTSLSMVDDVVPLLKEALQHPTTDAEYSEKQRTCDIMELLGTHSIWQNRFDDGRYYIERAVEGKCSMLSSNGADEQLLRCKHTLGICLCNLGDFVGALDVFREVLDARLRTSSNSESYVSVADCTHQLGMCALALNNFGEAIEQFQQELNIRQAVIDDDSVFGPCCKMLQYGNQDITLCLSSLADSLVASGQRKKALVYLLKGLFLSRRVSYDETADPLVAKFCLQISRCYLECQQFKFALQYAKTTFDIGKKTPDRERDFPFRLLLALLGTEFRKAGNFSDALRSFCYELELHEIAGPAYNDSKMAECLHNIGRCHLATDQIETALEWFRRALNLRRKNCEVEATSLDVAIVLYSVISCYYMLRKLDEAVEHLQQLRAMDEAVTSDSRFSNHRELLIQCLVMLKKYEQAYVEYKEIVQQLPQKFDAKTWDFYCVGYWFMGSFDKSNGRYEKALQMFQQEKVFRSVLRTLTNSARQTDSLRACNRNIGICFFKLGSYKEALESFKLQMEIL